VLIVTGFGVALVPPAMDDADAQTATKRRVTVTVSCKLTRGEPISNCRGTWEITRGIKDSGKVVAAESNDRDGRGAALRATLRGRKGDISLRDDAIKLSHRRRGCDFVTAYSLRGETGSYVGYRGDTPRAVCVKLRFAGRSITRTSKMTLTLEKR